MTLSTSEMFRADLTRFIWDLSKHLDYIEEQLQLLVPGYQAFRERPYFEIGPKQEVARCRATTPDPNWKAYEGKAARLFRDWDYLPVLVEGEWVMVGRVYGIGAKMLRWMCEKGMLERRCDTKGDHVEAWLNDYYRRPASDG